MINLNHISDCWTVEAIMPTKRSSPGVAALGGKIYLTGGTEITEKTEEEQDEDEVDEDGYDDFSDNDDEGKKLKSVECYDPVTKTWTGVADMNYSRSGHVLVAANGLLYAIGGNYEVEGKDEVYNPEKNTWTLLKRKSDEWIIDACVMKKKYYVCTPYYYQQRLLQ